MRKFKLFALALAIGTGSLFAASVVGSEEPEIDEEYESEELFDEAYGDAAFYKKLQQENIIHKEDINYWSKNLTVATITDDNHGLELFEAFLNENYKTSLNDDNLMLNNNINVEQTNQCIRVCNGIVIMDEKNKVCSGTLKITKR